MKAQRLTRTIQPKTALPCDEIARCIFNTLTQQQRLLAACVHASLSDKEIAETMCMSIPGVRRHLDRIANRCGFKTRVQIALLVERSLHSQVSEMTSHALFDSTVFLLMKSRRTKQ